MKAKFGKLSIVCFVLTIIAAIGFVMSADCKCEEHHGNAIMSMLSLLIMFLSPCVGILFGYLSGRKEEKPSCYRSIGLFLNAGWFLFWVILVLI